MSFPTQQAFIHSGDWDEETRKHPAMKWMERYTREQIDVRTWANGADPNEWHTSDFALQKSDGTRREGADKANDALGEIYGPFTGGQKHEPTFLVCWEEGDGWSMIGHAKTYVGFQGVEGTITDNEGKNWSAVMEAAFRFWYVKDESGPDGIKIKETRIYADPMPALGFMLQNKMVSPKDLGLA
ncbi:hypothetical protein MBLNU13_g05094t3 [Cladosporium sp. NU13]